MIAISIEVNCEQGGIRWHGYGWWEEPPIATVNEMLAESISIAVVKGVARRVNMGERFDFRVTGDKWDIDGVTEEAIRRWEKGKGLDDESRIHWERVAVETWAVCEGNYRG